MDRLRWETSILLRCRASPVRFEISPTEEEQCEEITNRPRSNHSHHGPIRPAEFSRGTIGKYSSIEK